MVLLFLEFLRTYFDVQDEAVRIDCNLFADHEQRQHEIEAFWLEFLRLPPNCLRRSTVNVYSKHTRKKRTNMLPYGTCRLVVQSTRVAQSILGGIQEYGAFRREEWLG